MLSKIGLVILLFLITVAQSKTKKDEKLVHDFEKINQFLEEHVESKDVDLLVEEAKKRLGKMGFFDGRSLIPAFKTFVGLAEMVKGGNCSTEAVDLFTDNDIGADDSHLEPNHKLRPIDLVIQHYGYRFISSCSLGHQVKTRFIFKENHYQQIDRSLAESVDLDDVDMNMAKIEELYESYNKENSEGAMTDALRNILAIKQSLNRENYIINNGFDIYLKNKLGLSKTDHLNIRRIEKIIKHYAPQHVELYRSVYPEKFDSLMNQLDLGTIKTMVTVTARFFGNRYTILNLDADSMSSYDDVKSQLTRQDNLKTLHQNREWSYLSKVKFEPEDIEFYTNLKLATNNQNQGSGESFRRNLLEPCKTFLTTTNEFYKRLNLDAKNSAQLYGNFANEFKPWTAVFFFNPALRTCKEVNDLIASGNLKPQ